MSSSSEEQGQTLPACVHRHQQVPGLCIPHGRGSPSVQLGGKQISTEHHPNNFRDAGAATQVVPSRSQKLVVTLGFTQPCRWFCYLLTEANTPMICLGFLFQLQNPSKSHFHPIIPCDRPASVLHHMQEIRPLCTRPPLKFRFFQPNQLLCCWSSLGHIP